MDCESSAIGAFAALPLLEIALHYEERFERPRFPKLHRIKKSWQSSSRNSTALNLNDENNLSSVIRLTIPSGRRSVVNEIVYCNSHRKSHNPLWLFINRADDERRDDDDDSFDPQEEKFRSLQQYRISC